MNRLNGKNAIVTGGASGIGKGIVELFIEEGARVLAADINEALLRETAAEMNQKRPGTCEYVVCDVTKSDQVMHVVDQAWDLLGTADILINNAGGSMNHPIHLMEITEQMWDFVFDLNLKSTFLFSQAFIRKHLEAGTAGVIVNMSSVGGVNPDAIGRPHYCAAKAGVIGLTKHMAQEFGPKGFRMNCVAPGFCMSSQRIADLWKLRDKDVELRNVALRRLSVPAEQAMATLFLASDDSSYITGEVLNVNGGKV